MRFWIEADTQESKSECSPTTARRALIGLLLLLSSAHALADDLSAPTATRAGIEIGLMANSYRYEEPRLMTISGDKLGARISYTRVDASGGSGKLELIAAYGKLQYAGVGVINEVPDFSYDTRMLIGRDLAVAPRLTLTLSSGLGYRYLFNDLRGKSSTGAVGYRRESSYLYFPLGLSGRHTLDTSWTLDANIEFDLLLRGHQNSKLSDTGTGLTDVRNDQRRGQAWRASLMIGKSGVSIGPWVTYWKIPDSSLAHLANGSTVIEPKNTTTEVGLEVRVRY